MRPVRSARALIGKREGDLVAVREELAELSAAVSQLGLSLLEPKES